MSGFGFQSAEPVEIMQVSHRAYASIFNLVMYTLVECISGPLFFFIDLRQQAKHAYFELTAETICLQPDLFQVFISIIL